MVFPVKDGFGVGGRGLEAEGRNREDSDQGLLTFLEGGSELNDDGGPVRLIGMFFL